VESIGKMRVADIVGARPQFIKVVSMLRAIEKHNNIHRGRTIEEFLIHTGQHYDYKMSQIFFEELELKNPDYHLGVGSGTHGYQTGEMLKRIEDVLIKEKPDLVLVYGDTNSTLSGALAAAKLHIPVAHVEAGLRSFNKIMPEEINRILTDHISDLLFCPTAAAVNNLQNEGLTKGVHLVGDVMYDAVMIYTELAERKSTIIDNLGLQPKCYALVTIHRSENTDNQTRLNGILQGLNSIVENGVPVVFPTHPRTLKQVKNYGIESNSLKMLDPVSYLDMLVLEKNAKIILTDSGGVQKEAFFFKVPCITLREETEWIETVETGWNTLAGCDPEQIVRVAMQARQEIEASWSYGDGMAAGRILKILNGG